MVSNIRNLHLAGVAAIALLLPAGLSAQGTAPAVDQPRAVNEAAEVAQQDGKGDCASAAGQAEAATEPQPGQDGTAPGNAGSSGWTGGTGGSHIGTNAQGALPESKTWQPPTARGLDLAGRPEPVAQTDQAAGTC
ncbi:hypothetical protein JJJ17_08035 [Paracoccus caeni]|uniref:Uncharacterized protein n=1 Tax=Paracoccus caeni TaxID=657651 RepID=A0A934SBQ0_9RHOB|nr:hypothetical protein [Paracoccus caeni]MBK4215871.1 hypothetical protein [Paracoccus caeni]